MRDWRQCYVWLRYTDGRMYKRLVWLDIDDCVEWQIRNTFESLSPNKRKLVDFKWDLVNRGFSLGDYEQEAHH